MNEKDLWKYFCENKISHAKPFDRDLIWVTKESFLKVQHYFVTEFNIVHTGINFRSRGYLSHIHAVDQGDCVGVHKDFGNLARFFPLGLLHLFCDVIPYYIFARIKGVSIESIFIRPK